MPTMLAVPGPVQIVIASTCLYLLIEFLSWAVTYRTSKFKQIHADIELTAKKLDSLKGAAASGNKKLANEQAKSEKRLMMLSRDLYTSSNMKVMFINTILMFTAYKLLSKTYGGMVMAKLPFQPFGFITKASHQGLPGDDLTDCSALFIYILCGMSIRANIARWLNLGPNKQVKKATSMQAWGGYAGLDKEKTS